MVLTKRDTGKECSAPGLTRLEALLTSWTGSAEHFNEEKVGKIEEIFHFYYLLVFCYQTLKTKDMFWRRKSRLSIIFMLKFIKHKMKTIVWI